MTGRCCTDYSVRIRLRSIQFEKHEYVSAYIQAAAVKGPLFPEILYSHDVVGTMTSGSCSRTGTFPQETRESSAAAWIIPACPLGQGQRRMEEPMYSLGSSSWIAVASEEPILDAKQRPYVFEHCIPGTIFPPQAFFPQETVSAGCGM